MSKSNVGLLVLVACLFAFPSRSQTEYLVFFKDKSNTPHSISQPETFLSSAAISRRQKQNIPIKERDLPVSPVYVQKIRDLGIEVRWTTKWLNGALVRIQSQDQWETLKNQTFISIQNTTPFPNQALVPVTRSHRNSKWFEEETQQSSTAFAYSNQLEMIGLDKMHQKGYTGKGVHIAIFDAGFWNANSVSAMRKVFAENRIIQTYDIGNKSTQVYDQGSHGMNVFSIIGAYDSTRLIGGAYDANFSLYHTELNAVEQPLEEAQWLKAAEMADSAGAQIINSSLGYTTFDNPKYDHPYTDLNGNKTIVAQAANIAFDCGILVVNSAGNYGNEDWYYIASPADATNVLSVAAVKSDGSVADFSSRGPAANGALKPEVAAKGVGVTIISPTDYAFASNGTSFSCPLITSFAACLWQAYPNLSAREIKEVIIGSSNRWLNPDNSYGNGWPSFEKAEVLARKYAVQTNSEIYPTLATQNQGITVRLKPEDVGGYLECTLFDIAGKALTTYTVQISLEINWFSLEGVLLLPGTYVARIVMPTKKYSRKFVIAN